MDVKKLRTRILSEVIIMHDIREMELLYKSLHKNLDAYFSLMIEEKKDDNKEASVAEKISLGFDI